MTKQTPQKNSVQQTPDRGGMGILAFSVIFLGLLFTGVWLLRDAIDLDNTQLAQIRDRGVLVVATRNGPTSYYQASSGPAGMEFDMAVAFAEKLGVELDIVLADKISELNQLLLDGEVDIVASGLPVSESSRELIQYAPVYQRVQEQVIDKQKTVPRVNSFSDLTQPLHTLANTNHLETLNRLQSEHPDLRWKVEQEADFEELLERVNTGEIPYALANSNEVQRVRHYYPELRVAFTLPEEKPIAWALRKSKDLSLITEVRAFFATITESGFLTQLQERYYGHVESFDYSGTQLFNRRIHSRLPTYEAMFRSAASKFDLDWRLLAAMSHQESQWNPRAISPTGVRGLMMLTLITASQMGVTNRLDPKQSIFGGAEYFAQMLARMPESIVEPDRTWMALAAYNVGFGHLTDARQITEMRGMDKDIWVDVKENLPLLRQKKWYSQVKYGYARGTEPVHYVQNIRRYYDILKRRNQTIHADAEMRTPQDAR